MKRRHINSILILLAFSGIAWLIAHRYQQTCVTNPGKIIIITGVSSSGKSSVAQELQSLYANNNVPFLLLHVDDIIANFPKQWVDLNPTTHNPTTMNADGLLFKQTTRNGISITKDHIGTLIHNTANGIAQATKAFACAGINVIYEGGLEAPILAKTINIAQPTATICVTAPLEVLEQREKSRGGFIGLSRGQFTNPNFFDEKLYDLTIDSSTMTPTEAAQQIYNFVK